VSPAGEPAASLAPTEASGSGALTRFAHSWERVDLPLLVLMTALAYRGLALSAPLRSTIPAVERFFFHPSQNSPDITLLAMVALLLADWRRLVGRIGRARVSASAGLFLLAAVALHLWSAHTQALQVDLLSLGCFLIGAALALGGWPLARLVLLPASLLLVAIPIPVVLINQLVLPLQAGTVALSTFFLDLIGRDYATSGSLIYSGGRAFQVIDTCTGLRSISTMLMATVVYVRVFHKNGWHAGLLLALAAPISFFFNGVRVVAIILSAEMTLAEDHTLQGIVVMIVSVLVLHAVAQGLDRFWPAPQHPAPRRPRRAASRNGRVAVVLAVLALLLVGRAFVTPWKAAPDLSSWTIVMPIEWHGYKARMLRLNEDYFGSVDFDRHLQRRYEREGEASVDVLVGMQRRVGTDQSLLSDKLGLPGASDILLSESVLELDERGIRGRATLTRGSAGVRLNYSWFRGIDSFPVELFRAFFALDRSELHREGGAYALRVSTLLEKQADLPAASERLAIFAAFLDGLLPEPLREGA
jgi:exosortase